MEKVREFENKWSNFLKINIQFLLIQIHQV